MNAKRPEPPRPQPLSPNGRGEQKQALSPEREERGVTVGPSPDGRVQQERLPSDNDALLGKSTLGNLLDDLGAIPLRGMMLTRQGVTALLPLHGGAILSREALDAALV